MQPSKRKQRALGDGSGKSLHRRGVLQSAEQRPADAAPIEFLIDFVRALIRLNPSSDCMYLALASAKGKHSLTDAQTKSFVEAICSEMGQSS